MKKLLILATVLIGLTAGCKKEDSKKADSNFSVHYNFEMNGASSKLVYTSIKDGQIITLTNITTTPGASNVYPAYKILDKVKVGDHIRLEMSATQTVSHYAIIITYFQELGNGLTIDAPIILKSDFTTQSGNSKIVLEHTFTRADFNN